MASYQRTGEDEIILNNNANHNDVKFASTTRRQRSPKASRILLAIVVVLLLACIALIVLYCLERARSSEKATAEPVCSNKPCIHVASGIDVPCHFLPIHHAYHCLILLLIYRLGSPPCLFVFLVRSSLSVCLPQCSRFIDFLRYSPAHSLQQTEFRASNVPIFLFNTNNSLHSPTVVIFLAHSRVSN